MGKYGEALGIAEFTVSGLDIEIKPTKGDNKRLLQIQKRAGTNTDKFFEEFIPYITEIINRTEQYSTDSVEYKELELFCEMNAMDLMKEVMIAYKWTTREKWDEQEAAQTKGFLKANAE